VKVCVTGASGRAGRAVVVDLHDHGYHVLGTDIAPEPESAPVTERADFIYADLLDYGQVIEIMAGVDAVIHLANIPAPGLRPPAITFNQNMTMNFNVFQAAVHAGVSRVVWASSETTLGLPFDVPPRYAPVDEDHFPFPTTTYALSKVATEAIAEHMARWSGIPFIALRFSNILGPDDYQEFPSIWDDPQARKWNLWGYIDERDVATACRLAVEADVTGSPSFIIAAADTVMTRPSAELMAQAFPGVPLRGEVAGNATLLSGERARQVLGFEPEHSWRQHLSSTG
jgi:nucleoside-diphosphate-sugar epimerase